MLDRAGDLALKTPDALLRVDEHSAHHPPPFRWLGNLFQNGPMCGHGDRAISPPKHRATVLPAVPTTAARGSAFGERISGGAGAIADHRWPFPLRDVGTFVPGAVCEAVWND